MIVEDIKLERPGKIRLEIGRGFEAGSYGSVEIRGTGPIGVIYSASRFLTFSNCIFQDAEFEVEENSWVNFRDCTFIGKSSGLDRASIGSARGNLEARDSEINFPTEYRNPTLYKD